ncbi:MAG: carbamate kinase [Armatimonadetes bacterium]|nr:carbamate kinase [Armatimonadota bacterium]
MSVVVIAVGGNSLIKDPAHSTVPDQYRAVCETVDHVVPLIQQGWRVVLTHGNGPQVGFIIFRSELSRHMLHEVPLDSCVADTQGAIGYQFQLAMGNAFRVAGLDKRAVTVVTQVEVDPADPAFVSPNKPIGGFMKEDQARQRKEQDGWDVMEDAGRGWRRVVPSPMPLSIVELDIISRLVEQEVVVIAVGGGGIPVVRRPDGSFTGTAAVIDKDRASSLLASHLQADAFLISTAVEKVYLNFNTPQQKALETITVAEAQQYLREGHFKAGSMKPKVEAAIDYLRQGRGRAVITNPENIGPALAGQAGTQIVPG